MPWEFGLKLDTIYHGMELPAMQDGPFRLARSSCSESSVRDIGLIGKPNG